MNAFSMPDKVSFGLNLLNAMNKSSQQWMEGDFIHSSNWNDLPNSSRVWLHCANRTLASDEQTALAGQLEDFLIHWSAHGKALEAGWKLEGGRCLMIGLNEAAAGATGCSIDKLSHFLQGFIGSIQSQPLDWMQRNRVLYNKVSERQWSETPLAHFWAMRKAVEVSDEDLVVNTVVQTKADCEPTLVRRFELTWHAEMWR